MTEVWLFLVPAGALGLHLAFARYNSQRTHGAWNELLSDDLHLLDCEEVLIQGDAACLSTSTSGAVEARDSGNFEEAVRLLTLAYLVVQEAIPSRTKRLQAMLRFARMAVALKVPAPLRPSAFKLKQLGFLAGSCALLHHLLVAPSERFSLRVRLLLFGFRLVVRSLTTSRTRIERSPAESRAWRAFTNAAEDFRTLDLGYLEAFRCYVESARALQAR